MKIEKPNIFADLNKIYGVLSKVLFNRNLRTILSCPLHLFNNEAYDSFEYKIMLLRLIFVDICIKKRIIKYLKVLEKIFSYQCYKMKMYSSLLNTILAPLTLLTRTFNGPKSSRLIIKIGQVML